MFGTRMKNQPKYGLLFLSGLSGFPSLEFSQFSLDFPVWPAEVSKTALKPDWETIKSS